MQQNAADYSRIQQQQKATALDRMQKTQQYAVECSRMQKKAAERSGTQQNAAERIRTQQNASECSKM
jgi:hypothetical protein